MSNIKKNRIIAIDFARGISILLVIFVHTMLIYGSIPTQTNSVLGEIILWMGRGTPMFLVIMGISFNQSRKQDFSSVCKRAILILSVGYFLNILKFWVPEYIFGGLPEKFVEAYGLTSQTLESAMFFLCLGDILQLAGITLFIIAIINLFSQNKWIPLLIGLLIIAVSKEVSGYRLGITGIDYLCDLLFSNKFNVYFPVFPWSSFILIGVFLGKWLKELHGNQEVFFRKIVIQGLLFVFIGALLIYLNPEYHFGDYYHLGPGGSVVLMGAILIFLWLSNLLVIVIGEQNKKFFKGITYLSKNVTSLYVIQWVLINWGMYVFGFWRHNQFVVALLIPVMTLLTLLVNTLFLRLKQKNKLEVSLSTA
ncbi:heparan-alpha-glucosaminide N-acetyltransferase domain-containing protein [Flavobacterium sp.]|uniref:heparan-alpha-glucosaminide N-acetyltransferase domain-containing protein n=2 Tax=Flavobacterium sp. TaxID=239 RepID=UPI00404711E9